uniref:SJCHGC06620 protein n=1 Tax=Schistosoma japonicum TaxID=6182 RepID=Q5DDK4_SCHJA|nr:SJCHGC06620 protein [Schistosoma japonicum]
MGIYNSSHPDITFMGACCAKSCFYCIRTYCFLVVCKEQSQHLVYFLSGVVSDSVMQPAAATVGSIKKLIVMAPNKSSLEDFVRSNTVAIDECVVRAIKHNGIKKRKVD